MASYYNPSKRLSEWAAASLSPYIRLESESPSRHAAAAVDLPNQANNSNSSHAQLSVGIWSGNVQLNNVELRPEAFEHFLNGSSAPPSKDSSNGGVRIQWKVHSGTIDSINVSIPWKSLLVGSSYSSTAAAATSTRRGMEGGEESSVTGKGLLASAPKRGELS